MGQRSSTPALTPQQRAAQRAAAEREAATSLALERTLDAHASLQRRVVPVMLCGTPGSGCSSLLWHARALLYDANDPCGPDDLRAAVLSLASAAPYVRRVVCAAVRCLLSALRARGVGGGAVAPDDKDGAKQASGSNGVAAAAAAWRALDTATREFAAAPNDPAATAELVRCCVAHSGLIRRTVRSLPEDVVLGDGARLSEFGRFGYVLRHLKPLLWAGAAVDDDDTVGASPAFSQPQRFANVNAFVTAAGDELGLSAADALLRVFPAVWATPQRTRWHDAAPDEALRAIQQLLALPNGEVLPPAELPVATVAAAAAATAAPIAGASGGASASVAPSAAGSSAGASTAAAAAAALPPLTTSAIAGESKSAPIIATAPTPTAATSPASAPAASAATPTATPTSRTPVPVPFFADASQPAILSVKGAVQGNDFMFYDPNLSYLLSPLASPGADLWASPAAMAAAAASTSASGSSASGATNTARPKTPATPPPTDTAAATSTTAASQQRPTATTVSMAQRLVETAPPVTNGEHRYVSRVGALHTRTGGSITVFCADLNYAHGWLLPAELALRLAQFASASADAGAGAALLPSLWQVVSAYVGPVFDSASAREADAAHSDPRDDHTPTAASAAAAIGAATAATASLRTPRPPLAPAAGASASAAGAGASSASSADAAAAGAATTADEPYTAFWQSHAATGTSQGLLASLRLWNRFCATFDFDEHAPQVIVCFTKWPLFSALLTVCPLSHVFPAFGASARKFARALARGPPPPAATHDAYGVQLPRFRMMTGSLAPMSCDTDPAALLLAQEASAKAAKSGGAAAPTVTPTRTTTTTGAATGAAAVASPKPGAARDRHADDDLDDGIDPFDPLAGVHVADDYMRSRADMPPPPPPLSPQSAAALGMSGADAATPAVSPGDARDHALAFVVALFVRVYEYHSARAFERIGKHRRLSPEWRRAYPIVVPDLLNADRHAVTRLNEFLFHLLRDIVIRSSLELAGLF